MQVDFEFFAVWNDHEHSAGLHLSSFDSPVENTVRNLVAFMAAHPSPAEVVLHAHITPCTALEAFEPHLVIYHLEAFCLGHKSHFINHW